MKARVLVVDDAATVRMYHRKLLADAGWETEEAVNGMEAWELLQRRGPEAAFDLLVVDINMPKMDGYSLVQALRSDTSLTQPPVLMVSTESQQQDGLRAREAGANCYVIKPAKPQYLVLAAALLLGDAGAARKTISKE